MIVFQAAERRRAARKGKLFAVPRGISEHLRSLLEHQQLTAKDISHGAAPKTFGVYLGDCSNPPTPLEAAIFKEWDIIVLDPCKPGIISAINSTCTSSHILGRLDIASICQDLNAADEAGWKDALTAAISAVREHFAGDDRAFSPCTGVLLANWQAHLPPIICRELIKHLRTSNFDVLLELSEPDYLTDFECRNIGLDLIKGLICRNGTIRRNGDRRDYYQMTNMRRAQRALAKHMSLGGIVFAMWETIDDTVGLTYSVVNRSFLW